MSREESSRRSHSPSTPDWRIQSLSTLYSRHETASICTECRNKLIEFIPLDQWTSPKAHHSADHVSDAEASCATCFIFQLLDAPSPYLDLIDIRSPWDADLTRSVLEYSHETGKLEERNVHSIDRSKISLHTESVDPSAIHFQRLREKLHLCLEGHIDCCGNGEEDDIPGLWLIDSRTRKIDPVKPGRRYVALSYVWGNYGTSRDASGTLLTELPGTIEQTIEDALVVVLNMGYRYLWVDKYCIDQNDAKSKKHQIRRMGSIYRNAAFTIIAAAGGDANYGLPGVKSWRGTRPRVPKTSCMIGGFLIRGKGYDHESHQSNLLRNSTWNTRGWTYQEGLLSKRCLVFTDEQVLFACRIISVDEGSESRPTAHMTADDDPFEWFFTICRGAGKNAYVILQRISTYSERILTNPRDILDAFSGIMRAFQKHDPPVHHLWGVPIVPLMSINGKILELGDEKFNNISSHGFSMGLSWIKQGVVERRHGFPSWSWAGWTGEVSFDNPTCNDVERELRITDALSDDELSFRVYVELEDHTKLDWAALEEKGYLTGDHRSFSQYIWLDTWELQVTVYWSPSEQHNHGNDTALYAIWLGDYNDHTRGTPLCWSCPQYADHVMKAGSAGVVATVITLGSINTWCPMGAIVEPVQEQDEGKGNSYFECRASLRFRMLYHFEGCTDSNILKKYISRRLVRLG